MLAADYQVGQFLWSLLWFTMFFIWIWLLIMVFADIFRSHDLGGFAKFLWVAFIIFFPYLGVLVYLIARGGKMHEHAVQQAQTSDAAARGTSRAPPADRAPLMSSAVSPTSRRRASSVTPSSSR